MVPNRDNSKQSGTVVFPSLPHLEYCISYCDYSYVSRAMQLVKRPLVFWLYSLPGSGSASTLWVIVRHLEHCIILCIAKVQYFKLREKFADLKVQFHDLTRMYSGLQQ